VHRREQLQDIVDLAPVTLFCMWVLDPVLDVAVGDEPHRVAERVEPFVVRRICLFGRRGPMDFTGRRRRNVRTVIASPEKMPNDVDPSSRRGSICRRERPATEGYKLQS
jgi:hypothetical protein